MFWILRRTGAVNFFNSINNNYSAKSNTLDVYNSAGKKIPQMIQTEIADEAFCFILNIIDTF